MRVLFFALLCSTLFACQMTTPQNDEGYFLSCGQQCDLFMFGEVQDAQKNCYNYTLYAGYVKPTTFLYKKTQDASTSLTQYIHAPLYSDFIKQYETKSKNLWQESIQDNGFNWTYDCWRNSFNYLDSEQAYSTIEKIAYTPVAFLSGTTKTALSLPFQIIDITFSSLNLTLMPPLSMTFPLIKAPAYILWGTTSCVLEISWQTFASPYIPVIIRPDSATRSGFFLTRYSAPPTDEQVKKAKDEFKITHAKNIEAFNRLDKKLASLNLKPESDICRNPKVRDAIGIYLVKHKVIPLEEDFKELKDKKVITEIIFLMNDRLK